MSFTEIGDGVFRLHYDFLDQNIGIIVAGSGVMVIDTRSTPSQAEAVRTDLKAITSLPVRWVVNTHYHWDHTFGNSIFEGAVFWGHVCCRQQLLNSGADVLASLAADAELMQRPEMADLADVVIVPPTETFSDHATLDVGGLEIELRYLGLGHTNSDIVVRVSSRSVVFAGDLIEEGAPPSFGDSYPREWVTTLEALLGLPEAVLVPGHGQVVDRGFVIGLQEQMNTALEWFSNGGEAPFSTEVMNSIAGRLG